MTQILKVRDLEVGFYADKHLVNSPLRGINLEISAGETLGLVGETGCGKSLTANSIIGLLPATATFRGEIDFAGQHAISATQIAELRGSEISMIFQNPQSAFNPIFTIKAQLKMVAERRKIPSNQVDETLSARLKSVGFQDIDRVLNSYPHELSGGMLQRCMIAMALLATPKLLIADEPTTALDATIGHQILGLIHNLQKTEKFAMLFISHDITSVAKVSDFISVLYAGRVVENGPTDEVINNPIHPYTKGLLGAIPTPEKARGTLTAIPGNVPSSLVGVSGCSFAERCSLADQECQKEPPVIQIGNQTAACWKAKK